MTKTNVITWVLLGVLSIVFAFSGISKLLGLEMHVDNFARWGYPAWFMFVVGAGETLAAALLLWRPASGLAAAGLTANMFGAMLTHIVAGEFALLLGPAVLLAIALFVARQRWDTLMAAVHWVEHPHMPHRH